MFASIRFGYKLAQAKNLFLIRFSSVLSKLIINKIKLGVQSLSPSILTFSLVWHTVKTITKQLSSFW